MPSTSTINMFEDNILIEIDGVASTWDTYCLGLNIVTPGSKRVIFRFKDIGKAIREGSSDSGHITNEVSSTLKADNVKTEPDLVETCVKFEEDDKDSINSVNVSPCNLLSRRCGNPNARPTDPFAPWRYSVRPFDRSNIPSEAAKRKALHQDIKDYACKRRKL
ncbi:uncharacterized protein F5891DRAFT_1212991 [Suillus fuscotomentosus]|uniref:Uncharacterized protein n=1 Tax=Suillus fuscotomentosus TaxID=1912939 RepID=A0AAD4EB43_9AGAM|nr:uncharacterized protein F5891DRAFT_1212991 [Suillus fuscotomentosus]KAG1903025.1 hypothetical protein F5891DRAFT_1212991 [Suillus fuscotomentosus]